MGTVNGIGFTLYGCSDMEPTTGSYCDTYDEGQPMKVIASKPTPGLTAKRVGETLLPSVFWNERLVQNGEVEIATPAAPGQENQIPNQP
jgi:hypothetical protein